MDSLDLHCCAKRGCLAGEVLHNFSLVTVLFLHTLPINCRTHCKGQENLIKTRYFVAANPRGLGKVVSIQCKLILLAVIDAT